MIAREFKNVLVPPKIAGIKTALPAHSMAWLINQLYGVQFRLSLDWQKQDKHILSHHHHFFCRFEDVELNWHLIQNKGNSMYFCQTKPLFDYLLICNGEDIYSYFERAVEAIKPDRQISIIFPFDFGLLKQKEAYYENFLQTRYFIEDLHV